MSAAPIDQFELLMHGVQAMRRHVERLACPIQGGSGVRHSSTLIKFRTYKESSHRLVFDT